MIFKRHKSKIFGAVFTKDEEKAIDAEINRQIAEREREHARNMDALVLWCMHTELGFGEKRLKRFYTCFAAELDKLLSYYEMGNEDATWLCTYKLKEELGIDISEWEKECTK